MAVSDKLRRQLYEAISSGDLPATIALVRKTPVLLEENWNVGDSFLHLAASKGQDKICAALIDGGIDVNKPGDARTTAIANAAAHGHLSTLKLLHKKGALVDGLPTSIATPLMSASLDGYLEIVKVLLDAGAEINREHLRLPQTALDFAVFYQVKNTGQAQVAELLRSRGAIRPYTEKHDWGGVPGQRYIEHVERAVGGFVNPLVLSRTEFGRKKGVAIYQVRIPKKYDHQLLFSVGLAATGFEFALCLPSAWPLNRSALEETQFNWPIRMLNHMSAARLEGLVVKHGDLLTAGDSALRVVDAGGIGQWLMVLYQSIDTERKGDDAIAGTLLLVPVTGKKPLDAGPQASGLADKKSQMKWEKVAVPFVQRDNL